MLTTQYPGPLKQAGNGVITAFSGSWKILAQTDLDVWKIDSNGVQSGLLVLGVDYTVVFDPIAETWTVTYTIAPVNGGFSLVGRQSDNTQQTLFPREGNAPAKMTEAALDKLQAQIQEWNATYQALVASGLIASSQSSGVVTLSGLFANRPASPAVPTIYESTDRGSVEYWSVTLQKWFLFG